MSVRPPDETATPSHDHLDRPSRADGTPPPPVSRRVVVNGAVVGVQGTRRFGAPAAIHERPRSASITAAPSPSPAEPVVVAAPHTDRAPAPRPFTLTLRPPAGPPAVDPDDLPPDVRRLLWYHVDTVEKIAVLDHARTARLPWTSRDAAASLGVTDRAVVVAAVGLCQAELLRRHGDTYERTPKAAVAGAALDAIRRAHGGDARHVLRVIERLAHGRSTT